MTLIDDQSIKNKQLIDKNILTADFQISKIPTFSS